MAGFSINLKLLVQFKDAYFSPFSNNYLEGAFLENFVTLGEMEAKAESCTKVSRTYSKSCFLVIIQNLSLRFMSGIQKRKAEILILNYEIHLHTIVT